MGGAGHVRIDTTAIAVGHGHAGLQRLRLRAARPGADFTISMRVGWNGVDRGALRALVDRYAAMGVQHLLVAPEDRNVDDWEAVTEGVGSLVSNG